MRPLTSFIVKYGRRSASVPSSWTGTIPGCWSWPPICASSTKRRTTSAIVAVPPLKHLERQVAAQVDVAGPEHHAHAAAGDLAQKLVAAAGGAVGQVRQGLSLPIRTIGASSSGGSGRSRCEDGSSRRPEHGQGAGRPAGR